MAGNVNRVFLMGNLTRDIELRHTSGNNAVGNFGLAVNRKYRTQSGEKREEVTFVDCEAWGKTAEVMSQYLSKGRAVFVEGRLKLDTWEGKDGTKQSKLRVVVDQFQFVDSAPGGGDRGGSPPSGGGRSYSGGHGSHTPVSSDDIPF